ncbi:MAG: FmdB family zinc ribbon protein [Steroidobacteraceae bacterium]
MPFYEYQCKSCGHELEAMQKVSDSPLRKCPHCGKPQLVRLMSAPVFRLKGAGWYETDFKGDKDNQRNLADRPEADAPAVAKDAEAAAATLKATEEGKGSEAKAPEAAPGDAAQAKDMPADKAADKPADKPATAVEKSAVGAARKPAAGKSAMRGRTASAGKSAPKRPARIPAANPTRSRR